MNDLINLTPHREPSRIYITSPSFGIDLSVPWLSAGFRREIESMNYGFYGPPRRTLGSLITRQSFHLDIEFGLGDQGAFIHSMENMANLHHPRRVFILDEKIPPLPDRPIWLPPGCWECAYCTTTQNADLLQCRGCGAPRIGEDVRKAWGSRS